MMKEKALLPMTSSSQLITLLKAPDSAPSDFYLFPKLKTFLNGKIIKKTENSKKLLSLILMD